MAVHPYLLSDRPLALAHRGGALEAPENAREAFEYAVNLGFRYLETDVHLSSDGVVVAFHDSDLDRVSDATGPVNTWEWSDLAKIELYGGGSMLTIEDLLSEFPDVYLNIDAKSDEVTEPLLKILDRHDAYGRVCLGSFSDERLRKIRRHGGDKVCTSLGPRGSLRFALSSFALPLEIPQADALQLPPTFRGVKVLTKRLISHAHQSGLKVHAWTIDDPTEMNRLLDMGIDGIMTDCPSVLKGVFADRGLAL